MTMTITTAGFIIVSAIAIIIFIIITLLPMSLILVLKLAISRTESAISPVAKFCTTWWTHQPPTSYFQQEFCSSLLSFVRSFFVSTMKLGSKKWYRWGKKLCGLLTSSNSPKLFSRLAWKSARHLFCTFDNYVGGVVLLMMKFCMFCIPRICYHILHDRTFWRRKILEKTFKACQHQGAGRFANNISRKRHRKDDGRLENENRHLSRSLPQRTILLSSSTLATCTAFQWDLRIKAFPFQSQFSHM